MREYRQLLERQSIAADEGLSALARLMNIRFAQHLERLPGPVPRHVVEFSARITTSWALIYYRRHLVRLSPYLFLLESHQLKHGSHWKELDATLRHEAAHAAHFARTGQTGHDGGFHDLLTRLGVQANGQCDLGPENEAFRYVYACPGCNGVWHRRAALRGNWSCGSCAPGRYVPEYKMGLMADLGRPWSRLQIHVRHISSALAEGLDVLAASPPGPSPASAQPVPVCVADH